MNRKKLMTILIAGVLIVFSGNAIAIQSNSTDTLDIEQTAIGTINNSISLKTLNKQTELAQNQYSDVQSAAQMALGRGLSSVQLIIYNPINAENLLNQAVTTQDVNTNSVRVDAYSKYIDLLKANYAVNIQKALNDSLKKGNKETQMQLNKGLVSKNEARLIEINYLKSNYQLNSLEKSLDSAYMVVNLAMGEDISKGYKTLIDNNIVPQEKIKSLEDYIADALVNRGEIVNAQSALDAKKKLLEYDKATYHTDYRFYIQQKQYEFDKAENDLEEAKINVQIEVTNGYKTLDGYMKTMESQQINYDTEKSNYESAKIKYDNGMITLSQLQKAEIAKVQAQINFKNAQLNAWLEQTKMNNATSIGPALK